MATAILDKPQEKHEISRVREPRELLGYPFGLMRRFSTEMDRMLEDFGFRPHFAALVPDIRKDVAWSPEIEIFERKGELVVRADLPGMPKEQVKVNVTDEFLTLEGERKHEAHETRQGFYRTERSYGAFARTIALPEGAKGELAMATFKNGVLEVTIPLTPRPEKTPRTVEVKTA
jgi:HSP20 family protein